MLSSRLRSFSNRLLSKYFAFLIHDSSISPQRPFISYLRYVYDALKFIIILQTFSATLSDICSLGTVTGPSTAVALARVAVSRTPFDLAAAEQATPGAARTSGEAKPDPIQLW